MVLKGWPTVSDETAIDLAKIKIPVSFYVAQFDEVCPAITAEKTKTQIGDALLNYKVYTDTRGHTFFAQSNMYATDVLAEFSIESGEAKQIKLIADEFLRRTGGYPNPAAQIGQTKEGACTVFSSLLTLAGLTTAAFF